MMKRSLPTLLAAAFLVAACLPMSTPAPVATPVPAPQAVEPTVAATATAAAWQTFTDAEAGFSLQAPPTWTQQTLPDQNEGAIHGSGFAGPEGGVDVYWGVGFGGACTTGTTQVQLAAGEVPACHAANTDGTEVWSQIDYQVPGGSSFSSRAYTSNPQPSSHDTVLQVLATLTFLPPSQPQTGAGLPNPASQNCVDQGGTITIEERGDGGQFGVCYFEDNMQCEEWALLRGDCPVGGVKVTGYATPAGRYCAITGGQYTVTVESGPEDEQGTCTFKDGSQCDAWDYYNGKCTPGAAPSPTPAASPAPATTIQPLPVEVCDGQAQAMAHALGVTEVTQSEVPLNDPVNNASGTGCQATVKGTGVQFKDPDSVVKMLGAMLESEGYTADPMLIANGPTGEDQGYRNGDEICWAGAQWWPDASANCPQDQPVSACPVTPQQQDYTVTLNCGVETAQAPAAPTAQATPAAGAALANPASVNCTQQGGKLSIEERGDGGQIGVCYFEDNRQCEEWALLRGDCPVGGLKVTGYITPAARYCAITGGQYAITGNSGAEDEQGTCTLPDGSQCDVWDYYNGTCAAGGAGALAEGGGTGEIVFDSTRAGEYRDLWVLDVRGAPPVRLTESEADNFAGPWSPDGSRVLYTCSGLTTTDLCVVNADGSGILNLTDTPDTDEGFPAWSPDGKQIAFTTRRDGNNEIYLMPAPAVGKTPPAAASTWVRLTDNPADDFAPAWSPDGSQIAFVSDRDQKQGIYDVYIMKADGSSVRRLTSDTAIDYSPAWSPDGKRIAFRSHHDGPADIYVISVDGSGMQNLTNDPSDDWAPSWSPDGTLIAFQTNRDGDWDIYSMRADGSQQSNLTNDPVADDQLPFWRP
jgi:Tol biopolymer transport system component/putative hemolysin